MNGLLVGALLTICLICSSAFQARAEGVGKLRILLSTIPPLVMSQENDQRGILYELALEIRSRWQNSAKSTDPSAIHLEILPWSRAYAELLKNPDIIMLQMARTAEREDKFQWLTHTGKLSFAFIANSPPAINSLDEARKVGQIAVYRDSRLEGFLKKNGFENLAPTDNSRTSARLLDAGRVHLWYASIEEVLWFHETGHLVNQPIIGNPIFQTPIWAVASLKTSRSIVQSIREILISLKKDGTFDRIRNKYGLRPLDID